MKKTAALLILVAVILPAVAVIAEAQQPKKFHRIGILRSGSASSDLYAPQNKIIDEGLRERGYIDGKNLLIEYRYADSKLERLPDLARELVGLRVDVLVISPSPETVRAAQEATRTIPIVIMGSVFDPVSAGFVESLARPGGNITGLTNLDTDLHGKRLGLLKEAFPSISRVAIIWNLGQEKQAMKDVNATAKALGINIQSVHIDQRVGLPSLESAFTTINQKRPEGLLVASIRTTILHHSRIVGFASERRLPTIYARDYFVDAGGLMSYNTDNTDIYRRVVTYVDKILRGSKPADLPIERPMKFEFVINLKAAKQIGLTIPQWTLMKADRVIQ
jgi:putative ABC transport system substrate-binding protein